MTISFESWHYEPELKSYVAFGSLQQGGTEDGVEVVVTPTKFGTMEIDVVQGSKILFRSHETMCLPEAKAFAKEAAANLLAA